MEIKSERVSSLSLRYSLLFPYLPPKGGNSLFHHMAEVIEAGAHIVPCPGGIGLSKFIIAYDLYEIHLIVFKIVVDGREVSLFIFPVAVGVVIEECFGYVLAESVHIIHIGCFEAQMAVHFCRFSEYRLRAQQIYFSRKFIPLPFGLEDAAKA